MNFKVRFKNPVFIVQIFLSVLVPILTYAGLTFQDLTSWAILGKVFVEAIQNPYVLGLITVSVWNALNDPTTEGLTDSKLAMTYDKPKPKSK
jgi:phi LC3 family holin